MAFAAESSIKLLLLIPHLGGGGAERVTTLVAQNLDPNRFEVHLGLITDDGPGAARLPSWVVVHRLNAERIRFSALKILALVWKLHPDLILSNMAHLNFLLLMLLPFVPRETRILVRQNTTASSASNLLTSFFYRALYPLATGVICQSEAMATDLSVKFSIPCRKIAVLPNPVTIGLRGTSPFSARSCKQLSLLCVARLSHEKGVDLLLHAMVNVKRAFPDIVLTILGTGPDESSLAALVDQLGLHSQVTFSGFVDPAPYFLNATIFVSSSRYEGMPNALLEAAAAGLPIVATPSSLGVTGLLRGAPGAWICSEVSAQALAVTLVEALESLLSLPPQKRRFRHAFLAPFETVKAIHGYEQMLLRVNATGHM
jgi:glycosyltransferase involved in cell wall biosynthesis